MTADSSTSPPIGAAPAPEVTARHSQPSRNFRVWLIACTTLSSLSAVLSALAIVFASGLVPLKSQSNIENQIRDYLLANPETIISSVNNLQARQQEAENNELVKVIAQRRDEIFNDPASPTGANSQGDATVVEFFDYNCPYCRKAAPMLDELERTDKGLRLVFKEFPILGPGSVFAAKAALASQKQGKYVQFHKAMMNYAGRITEATTMDVASATGLDVSTLKKDMEDPAIEATIQRNLALAEALHISGTPTFVGGKQIVRGLVDADTMKQLVVEARKD